MRNSFRTIFSALALLSLFVWTMAFALEDPDKASRTPEGRLAKGAAEPRYQVLNINNLSTWTRFDGQSNHSPQGDNGTYYPRGTRWTIYQDGVMWGGKAYLDNPKTTPNPRPAPFAQLIRVGGANYVTGGKGGWIEGSGATAVAANPNDALVRAYRVRRDWKQMSTDEYRRDAAETNEIPEKEVTDAQIAAIRTQYEKDWADWPVNRGAPYIERNGTPGYQPPPAGFTTDDLIAKKYDEPGIAGADPNSPADQVMWVAYNDLDRSQTIALQGSEPLGLEAQKTIWGYKRTDALGNLYFQKVRIINKGGIDTGGGVKGSFWIDSMYVAQWSDPDLGNAGDDLVGCDTSLSIGFVYNGNAIDNEYRKFNLPPPSAAYDFLQGPIIASPADSAVFDLKRRKGFKNLPMTSFSYFSAGSPISDPPRSYSSGTIRWYKMLRGFAPLDGADGFYPFPPGVAPNKFPLAGDPVAKTGFTDGQGTSFSFAPGDRRLNLSTGPFTLAPGDTQEIVVGVVMGLGADRLSSVAVMKFNDRFVQNTYDALFQVPRPPIQPNVKVAQLDGQVMVEWGSDFPRVSDTETRLNQPGNYKFEGYNVYQLPSRNSRLSEGKRIATYDLATDPSVVLDEQFDQLSGQVLRLPVQFGTNSGVTRFFNFNRDHIRDINRLYNGQEYYVAITAYSVSTIPGYLPISLESDPVVLTVRPQAAPPGTRYDGKADGLIPVKVTAGQTDVALPIKLIDPTRTKDATWTVSFAVAAGKTSWLLKNKGTGATVFSSTNLGALLSDNPDDDTNYPIVEGFQPIVRQIVANLIPDSSRWLTAKPAQLVGNRYSGGPPALPDRSVTTGANLGELYLGQFSSSYDHGKLRRVVVKFGTGNGSKAYRLRRTGAGTQYLIQTGVVPGVAPNGEGFVAIPFSAWDIDSNPARQLTITWRDQDNSATYNPPVGGDGVEVVFIHFRTYDPTGSQYTYPTNPDAAKRGPSILNECTVGAGADIMYGLSYASVGAQINGTEASIDKSEFYIRPTFTLNDAVVFEFTTKAPAVSQETAKKDVESIGVFPNPYYAFNAAETNRFNRFVTFNFLPAKATIRVFNLAGQLVKTMEKNDASQFYRWDLTNQFNFPVASGMYIIHIDMPDLGTKKVLKLAVIQEQEILDVF